MIEYANVHAIIKGTEKFERIPIEDNSTMALHLEFEDSEVIESQQTEILTEANRVLRTGSSVFITCNNGKDFGIDVSGELFGLRLLGVRFQDGKPYLELRKPYER